MGDEKDVTPNANGPLVETTIDLSAARRAMVDFGLGTQVAAIGQAIDAVLADIAKQARQLLDVTPNFRELFERIEARAPRDKETVRRMAARGWFMSAEFDLSMLGTIGDLFASNNEAGVDAFMVSLIQSRIREIQRVACSRFPARADILVQVFKAHELAMYSVAIPTLLAQIDGMAQEDLGESLYAKAAGNPKTKNAALSRADSPLSLVIYLPLMEVSGLSASAGNRNSWPEAC